MLEACSKLSLRIALSNELSSFVLGGSFVGVQTHVLADAALARGCGKG
jgi:hypothetical protein